MEQLQIHAVEPGSHVYCGSWNPRLASPGIGGDRGAVSGTNGSSRQAVRYPTPFF